GCGQRTINEIDIGDFVARLKPYFQRLEQLRDWETLGSYLDAGLLLKRCHQWRNLLFRPAHPRCGKRGRLRASAPYRAKQCGCGEARHKLSSSDLHCKSPSQISLHSLQVPKLGCAHV